MFGNIELRSGYTSLAQQARKISEDWVARNAYCLNCESDELTPTRANTKTRDFFCPECKHGYEVKSKRGIFSTKVLDGAYSAMLQTIREDRTPTFLLLEYSSSWSISGFKAVHHSLITEQSIVPRSPLAVTARRAGWIGCNILLSKIATDGQIHIIQNEVQQPRDQVRVRFTRLQSLSRLSHDKRSWAATMLNLIRRLHTASFHLADVYAFEEELSRLYPNNNNVRPKIRQQLQVLRDAGLVVFKGRGFYELRG